MEVLYLLNGNAVLVQYLSVDQNTTLDIIHENHLPKMSDNPEKQLSSGMQLESEGYLQQPARQLQQVLHSHPENVKALYRYGVFSMTTADTGQTIEYQQKTTHWNRNQLLTGLAWSETYCRLSFLFQTGKYQFPESRLD